MNTTATGIAASDSDWQRYETLLERFESELRGGGEPNITDHLPAADDAGRRHVLIELIKLDFEYRFGRGERPLVADYVRRFPELGDLDTPPHELIAAESRVRRGNDPSAFQTETSVRTPNSAPVFGRAGAAESSRRESTGGSGALRKLGRYELRDRLGRGGFAVVYRAWDPELNREVAIKVPRDEFADSNELIERVRREARSAAQLRHPAIVPIYEVGEDAGRTFIVYQFVRGPTLAALINETKPAPRQAASWVMQIAEALEYAHAAGIVHRDIKPANILMDRGEQPLIADFGLAHADDAGATLTHEGDILGTPAYMSPEQARGHGHRADARSDVYGLGVVLYELLTGRPPFEGTTASILQQVINEEPPTPSSIKRQSDVDLETICLKAMAKEPGRRYGSSGAMAEDLQAYLEHRPISARRIGPVGRVARWCRRKPVLAATIAVATAVTLTIAVFSFWRVVRERDHARELSADLAFDRAASLCEQGDVARGMLWFARTLELAPQRSEHLRWAVRANLDAWQHQVIRPSRVSKLWDRVDEVVFSQDGGTILARLGYYGTKAQLLNATTGEPIALPLEETAVVLAHSGDGRLLITRHDDFTARLWDLNTGDPVGRPLAHSALVKHAAFAADSRTVATVAGDDEFTLWDTATTDRIAAYRLSAPLGPIALSPDGQIVLAVSGSHETARLWNARTGEAMSEPIEDEHYVARAAFNSSGSAAMTSCLSGDVRLWHIGPAELSFSVKQTSGGLAACGLSPDGRFVWTGDSVNSARLWSTENGKPIGLALQHRGQVDAVAFSPNGDMILTGSKDRTARLWRIDTGKPIGAPLEHPELVTAVAFAPNGSTIVTGTEDGVARIWSRPLPPETGLLIQHDEAVWDAAFSSNGRAIVTVCGQPNSTACVQLWGALTGSPTGLPMMHPDAVKSVAISPDGSMIVAGCWDGSIRLWDAATGQAIGEPIWCDPEKTVRAVNVYEVSFSPDGRRILAGCAPAWWGPIGDPIGDPATRALAAAQIWDVVSRRLLARLQHELGVRDAAFSRDGRLIATASYDKTVRLWDAATYQPIGSPMKHQGMVGAVALSPDGRLLASGCDANYAQVWDVATQQPIGAPLQHRGTVRSVAFSPDGRLLVTGSIDKTARLWEPLTGKPIGGPLRHGSEVEAVAFSPDPGTPRIMTAGWDGAVRFWHVPSTKSGTAEQLRLWAEALTNMELDTHGAVRVLPADSWRDRRDQLAAMPTN